MEKYSGCVEVRITSEGQPQVRRKDGKPLNREDNDEAKRLILLHPDLPLDSFARRGGMLRMWSELHDEVIYFVSGEDQVKTLLQRGIPRQVIYASREIISLYQLTIDPNRIPSVREAKSFFLFDRKLIRSA